MNCIFAKITYQVLEGAVWDEDREEWELDPLVSANKGGLFYSESIEKFSFSEE